jgi:nitroreductase
MRFIELAEKRCSIRQYEPKPVPDALLNEILQAGCLAPTAKNLQPFRFVVVRDPDQLDRLAGAYPAPFLREAPVVIAVCADPSLGWVRERHDGKNYCEIDAAIAIDHMTLAAADAGLGTCWIGAFDPVKVRKVLQVPDGIETVALLPVGYPAEEGRKKTRKSLGELVLQEHF